ncbi:MAG TPA: hypothetical protein VJ860_02950, partial [Polyangia bacterium]|nr:hypothetical protein [Polyangia bacterium]
RAARGVGGVGCRSRSPRRGRGRARRARGGRGGLSVPKSPKGEAVGTADPDKGGTLWVSNWDQATIGSSDGDAPPEIAVLAQEAMLDTGADPAIPGHGIVIAAALTWLR